MNKETIKCPYCKEIVIPKIISPPPMLLIECPKCNHDLTKDILQAMD